ncbi:hypothetical protein [Streptomyces lateritius]|uniref:hypothetical protein n=1 Tax=Streptomyces lateritius TaxID=67313 RepID=UPI001E32EB0F|nr:hypothetical protein [Streptomyces lateritius]
MSESDGTKVVGVREQDEVNAATKKVSSEIYDLIGVEGTTSKGGPGVLSCEGKDREKFYIMKHPWSLAAETDAELAEAMERLKEKLPQHGWKIVKYGPDSSPSKSLELTADNDEKKFGVHISFWKQRTVLGQTKPPSLIIDVISGCYEVPEGQTVEHY